MKRRDFVTFLSGATAWVAVAQAQEPRRAIGILSSMSYGSYPGTEVAFAEGLKETGFTEDRNVSIEWRWAGRAKVHKSRRLGFSEPASLHARADEVRPLLRCK